MRRVTVLATTAAVLLSLSCGGDDDDSAAEGGAAPTTEASAVGPSAGPSQRAGSATTAAPTIGVSDFTFRPATVPPGATVRLANGDSVAHTVESRDGAWTFDEASQTFTAPSAPGDYAIFCGIHASMMGTLTVA